jgi:hypothetical protein
MDSPLGMTLGNPVEVGGILKGSNGAEIVVVQIVDDAWRVFQEHEYADMIEDPPKEGNRLFLITVEVSWVSDSVDESLEVVFTHFKLIGDNRVVHSDQFLDFMSDFLNGEIYSGGRIRGKLCFEIASEEDNLILIYEADYGRESRRFLRVN